MSELAFQGREGDSLSIESGSEFHDIINNWNNFTDPVQLLRDWCEHYYGRVHVPINYALQVWKIAGDDVWCIVEEEFKAYLHLLHEHETHIIGKADIRKIRRKLNSNRRNN